MSEDAVQPTSDLRPPIAAEDLSVTTLVVLCGCSDGKLRAVAFEGKNARQVHGYVRHIQGGNLKLAKEPLLILMDTPEHRRAIETADDPPQTKKKSWLPAFLVHLFRRKETAHA